jgi:hypothetical protein
MRNYIICTPPNIRRVRMIKPMRMRLARYVAWERVDMVARWSGNPGGKRMLGRP